MVLHPMWKTVFEGPFSVRLPSTSNVCELWTTHWSHQPKPFSEIILTLDGCGAHDNPEAQADSEAGAAAAAALSQQRRTH